MPESPPTVYKVAIGLDQDTINRMAAALSEAKQRMRRLLGDNRPGATREKWALNGFIELARMILPPEHGGEAFKDEEASPQ